MCTLLWIVDYTHWFVNLVLWSINSTLQMEVGDVITNIRVYDGSGTNTVYLKDILPSEGICVLNFGSCS